MRRNFVFLISLLLAAAFAASCACSSKKGPKDYSQQIRELQKQMMEEAMANDDLSMYYIEGLYFLISSDNNEGLVYSRVLYFGEKGEGAIYVFDPTGHKDAEEIPITYVNKLDADNAVIYNMEGDSTSYTMFVEDWVIPDPEFEIAFPKTVRVMNNSNGNMLYGGLITESKVMALLDNAGYANIKDNDGETNDEGAITTTLSRVDSLKQVMEEAVEQGEKAAEQVAETAQKTRDPNADKCPRCKGTGKCSYCNGVGKQRETSLGGAQESVPCTICKGSGKCKICGGTGAAN